jgi:hypothetical protein
VTAQPRKNARKPAKTAAKPRIGASSPFPEIPRSLPSIPQRFSQHRRGQLLRLLFQRCAYFGCRLEREPTRRDVENAVSTALEEALAGNGWEAEMKAMLTALRLGDTEAEARAKADIEHCAVAYYALDLSDDLDDEKPRGPGRPPRERAGILVNMLALLWEQYKGRWVGGTRAEKAGPFVRFAQAGFVAIDPYESYPTIVVHKVIDGGKRKPGKSKSRGWDPYAFKGRRYYDKTNPGPRPRLNRGGAPPKQEVAAAVMPEPTAARRHVLALIARVDTKHKEHLARLRASSTSRPVHARPRRPLF